MDFFNLLSKIPVHVSKRPKLQPKTYLEIFIYRQQTFKIPKAYYIVKKSAFNLKQNKKLHTNLPKIHQRGELEITE